MDAKPEESAQPTAPIPSRGEIASLLQALTRFALLLVGGLYTVGLLIVNLDLGRYGLISLDLARPEYVMAGALWSFLMVATIGAYQVAVHNIKLILSKGRSVRNVIQAFMVLVIFAGFPFFVLNIISHGEIGFTKRIGWLTVGTIGINAFILYQGIESARVALKLEKPFIRRLFSARADEGTPIYYFVILLSTIGLYAAAVYPHLPRVFGGGKKPSIQLVLSDRDDTRWKGLGLPISEDGRNVGPVILLLETEGMFIVTAASEGKQETWFPPVDRDLAAVGIEKKAVSALLYGKKAK